MNGSLPGEFGTIGDLRGVMGEFGTGGRGRGSCLRLVALGEIGELQTVRTRMERTAVSSRELVRDLEL